MDMRCLAYPALRRSEAAQGNGYQSPRLSRLGLAVPPSPPLVALRVHASERILAVEDPPKRRDPPLGLRAGPARDRAGLARAACPGVSGSVLHQQPHGVALGQGPRQPIHLPQVVLQIRAISILQVPLQPRQELPCPLRLAYLFDQPLAPLFHRVVPSVRSSIHALSGAW